jgi:hypothetical protein
MKMKRGWKMVLLAVGMVCLAGARAASAIPFASDAMMVDVDEAPDTGGAFQQDTPDYSIHGTVSYDYGLQRLVVRGEYVSSRKLADGARFSYQLYNDAGGLLEQDGPRFDLHARSDGKMAAQFEGDLPVSRWPELTDITLWFNCVVEGQYWYRDKYPATAFPMLRLVNLPDRTLIRRLFSWAPKIIPAQTRCFLPVKWAALRQSGPPAQYLASAEVIARNDRKVVDQSRLQSRLSDFPRDGAWQWQEFNLPEPGKYDIRPGWVWNGVRWYNGYEQNPFVRVRAIGPLEYFLSVLLAAGLVGFAWKGARRIGTTPVRWIVRILLAAAASSLAAMVLVNGYALLLGLLLAAWAVRRRLVSPGVAVYAVTVAYIFFLEFYWGEMSGVMPYASTALAVSTGGMAFLLLPLLLIKSRALARGFALLFMGGSLLLTTGLVVYYQFFQDFPSARDLQYASQVGELGGSIQEMVGQIHFVPVVFALLLLGPLFFPGAPAGRKSATRLSGRSRIPA